MEVAPEQRGAERTLAFEAFAEGGSRRAEPLVTGADGVRASRLVHAVYEAARPGTVVDVRATAG